MNTGRPLVTIGVPIYNGAKYVSKALESLLAQDYENFEIVISDNCSTDESLKICTSFASRDSRIRIHAQRRNIGALPNFGALIALAQGPYFMWAAVDDLWLPTFVSRAVAELEAHPDCGVAMTAVDRVLEDGTLYDQIRFEGDVNGKSHYDLTRHLTSTKKYNVFIYGIFHTPLLKAAMQFLPQVPTWERLLLCQIALAAKFRYIDEMLHIRMHHVQSFTTRFPDQMYKPEKTDWLPKAKIMLAYAGMLAQSPLIPWYRKIHAPFILSRYGWMLARPTLTAELRRGLGSRAWTTLAPLRKFFRG